MPANASPGRPVKASPAKPMSANALPVVASPSRGLNELETLQIAYDEYVEFSKEVESELEQSLKATEAKLAEVTTKKSQSEAKLITALAKSTQLSKELQQVQNDLIAARDKIRCSDEMTKKLENTNDALLDKVRILETTEGSPTIPISSRFVNRILLSRVESIYPSYLALRTSLFFLPHS
jgi:septal ring factor EnvC (AmiA/AmiB activator)